VYSDAFNELGDEFDDVSVSGLSFKNTDGVNPITIERDFPSE
jgi:hypothetical protein